MFGPALVSALARGLSCQPESSSPDTSGKASTEPASTATPEHCSPACSWQSQASAAALRGLGSSEAQPGMLAQGTPSWGRLPAKQGAEPSWERQVPAPGIGMHGRQHARGASWQRVVGRKHAAGQQLDDHEPESQAGVEAQALGFTSSLAWRSKQLWASLPAQHPPLASCHSLQGPAS